MIKWLIRNRGKILILYAIKVALFIPHTAHATTYTQLPATVGSSYLLMDRTALGDNPIGSYIIGYGYGGYDEMVASTPSGGCTGSGCSLENPVPFEKPLEGTGQYFTVLYQPSTDTRFYSLFVWETIDWTSSSTEECNGGVTRICDFNPQDNSTTSNPVSFDFEAYINEEDVGTVEGISITLHNIDQNVLFLSRFSQDDFYLINDSNITATGTYTFSTSTVLTEGNYRLEACIKKTYLLGIFGNPFSPINDCQSHQFIVGSSTFIGNISQRIWKDTNEFFATSSATSSEALASNCNPISGVFEIRRCMAFLFIPDAESLKLTMEDARTGILTRVPWGYLTRVVNILNSSATTTIPSWTVSFQAGYGGDMTPEILSVSVNPADMIAGAGAILDNVRDPITNKNAKDVFEPFVKLMVALAVVITIVVDITGSHRHAENETQRKGKLS